MDTSIRLALAQANTTVGDFEGNCRKILLNTQRAKEAGADIVLFPELTIPSYFPEDLLLKKKFVEDNQKYLRSVAKKIAGIVAIVGFVDCEDSCDRIYNAAAIIQNSKVAAIYHKICLPNYSVFDEKRYFVPGDRPMIFEFRGIKFGLNICEDFWVMDGVVECQGMAGGAEVILSISASPYHVGKRDLRLRLGVNHACFTRSIIAYLNLIGGQDELIFDGNSYVVDHQGALLCECKQFTEDFSVLDLDISRLRAFRAANADYQQERENFKSLYRPEFITLPDTPSQNQAALVTCSKIEPMSELQEVYEALVLGTHDYVRKNEFKKVVIGLSGGIDSALTAAIAVDALGKDNVIGILMPSEITSKASIDDAEALATNLNIQTKTIAIKPAFDAYSKMLHNVFDGLAPDTTEENLQARIRGNILMALSNKFGWLVLTTGNKSETSVGYSTLYGDMAGGFAVIKDVPKTMVYELCEYKNKAAGELIIPSNILTKPPTAELRPGQKDQDSLPPYELLDAILEEFVEKDKTVKELIAEGYPRDVVKRVARLVDVNEYKRRQAPPGIKITQKAFGKDRRMPIVNWYHT